MSIFFIFYWFKVTKRLMDYFSLGKYFWTNINVSNFISLYLPAEVNLKVVL